MELTNSTANLKLVHTKKILAPAAEPGSSIAVQQEEADTVKLQEAHRLRKEKDETFLRIMSQKHNSAWKQYLNDKLIKEDLLHQHVYQRPEEELSQIHRLLESEKWRTCASVGELNKPPDIVSIDVGNDMMIAEHEGSRLDSDGILSHDNA
ncbi:hypothetical protein RIF29_21153 [Crotalaria pallida]|uniref:Uncharacterized protein n=1 Tax=Crotalaria pallida TaxID=3830 RepID=A0AAN9F6X2_CROPI